MSGRCPKCGAKYVTRSDVLIPIFECGSWYNVVDNKNPRLVQSPNCRIRELEAENAKLQAELHAGSRMLHEVCGNLETKLTVVEEDNAKLKAELTDEISARGEDAAYRRRLRAENIELKAELGEAEGTLKRAKFHKSADGKIWVPPVNTDAYAPRFFAMEAERDGLREALMNIRSEFGGILGQYANGPFENGILRIIHAALKEKPCP